MLVAVFALCCVGERAHHETASRRRCCGKAITRLSGHSPSNRSQELAYVKENSWGARDLFPRCHLLAVVRGLETAPACRMDVAQSRARCKQHFFRLIRFALVPGEVFELRQPIPLEFLEYRYGRRVQVGKRSSSVLTATIVNPQAGE